MPYVYVPYPSPPPPPLSNAHAHWLPLYFFLALLGAWALVMLAVFASFRCSCFRGSATERQALNKPPQQQRVHRQASGFGEVSWYGVNEHIEVDPVTRAEFVRKVYAILSTQLIATVGVTVAVIYGAFYHGDPKYLTPWGAWILGPGYFLVFVILLLNLCTLCCLMGSKAHVPWNYLGLALFTLLMSFQLGIICAMYYGAGMGEDLFLAFVLTSVTFLTLTLFTIVSKIDFSFLAPLLCVGIFIFMIWSLILSIAFMFGGFSVGWQLGFVIFGMILFIGFILFDTYMITTRLGVDDYILGAVELYLDMINLFLMILQCLTLTRDN